jgi:asparaginyl-tRNA synthetase
MKDRTLLIDLFSKETKDLINTQVTVCGMIVTQRNQSELTFVDLNDGTFVNTLQIVMKPNQPDVSAEYNRLIKDGGRGSTICVTGMIRESPARGQAIEMIPNPDGVIIYSIVDGDKYPLPKAKMKLESIRDLQHLRIRTGVMSCIMRIRNTLSIATHDFFQKKHFTYVHTPLITSSDCEGAGETFTVTTLLNGGLSGIPTRESVKEDVKTGNREIDYSKDFFGEKVGLTVSGQLNVESYAAYLSNVYTFGPTFRAERSNTSRHLAEFWMIEPEMYYADFDDVATLAEEYLKYCINEVLKKNDNDVGYLNATNSKGLLERLTAITAEKFERITYTDAIKIFDEAIENKKIIVGIPEKIEKEQKHKVFFEYEPEWGDDLASEAERYLTDVVFKKPVIITDYPKDIKAFYMKENADGKTVQAMDILVPGIGEIIGGSAREENYDKLLQRIKEQCINEKSMEWYLDLRKFGTAPHGGFGLGFERLVMLCTGVTNIKDTIPFPRYNGHCIC